MKDFKKTILFLIAGLTFLFSQPSKVTGIFIASAGTEAVQTEDAPDRMESFAEYLSASLHFPFDEKTLFDASDSQLKLKSQEIYDAFDSSAFVMGGIFCAWEDGSANPGTKTAVSVNPNPVTMDYILNALQFYPAKRYIFFICSPAFAQFDSSDFSQYKREIAPGRLIINVTGPADDDYDDWVYSLNGIIDDMEELEPTSDGNLDRNISLSEWFIVLQLKAREEGLTLHPYLISKGEDFNLYQLEE